MATIQKAWGSYSTVTVAELRKILEGVPDEAELVVELDDTDPSEDWYCYVRSVQYHKAGAISGNELTIKCGERFGY